MGSNPAEGNYGFPQKLSSVEFPVTFSGGDTLLAQGIYLTDSIYISRTEEDANCSRFWSFIWTFCPFGLLQHLQNRYSE